MVYGCETELLVFWYENIHSSYQSAFERFLFSREPSSS